MHHKKGKPSHARGGPKWNKLWKLGRRNADAEPFTDHRRRDAADRELDEAACPGGGGSRRLFKLVRPGPLVPHGPRVEFTYLKDGKTDEVQPMAPESENLLGYLRLHDDGTLSYEEILGDADQSPETILDRVLDILGPSFHGPTPDFLRGARIRRTARNLVVPKMLNFVHSMGNHLASLQWKELDPADRE